MDPASEATEGTRSALRAEGTFFERVNRARLELLDLSTRNRLLNTPRHGRAKTVEVVNEIALAMYKTLVVDGKRFTFAAGRADPQQVGLDGESLEDEALDPENTELDPALIEQPDLELDEDGRVLSHWDSNLSTRLTSAGLQKRLLDLYIDARTLQEEQGVNVLYLAIGYLKWRAIATPQVDRHAP